MKGLHIRMKIGWKKGLAVASLVIIMIFQVVLAAAEPGKVLSFGTEDKNIILYIQEPGEEYEIRCQIGTREAEALRSYPITEEETPIETIILLDNSLSVIEKYRPTIHTILSELAANRMVGELFTVATFSEEVHYLIKDCSDYAQIKKIINDISYNNQETYLTDILYDMLTEINAENNTILKRIVIISDGVDNKSIGYTKEELYSLLEKTPYPIYTIGCTYHDNQEQLKNMFALSRMTGGEAYLLDEISDPMTIVNGVAELNHAVKVIVTPKDTDCDGTKKGVGLTVTTAGQTVTNTLEVTMPLSIVEESVPETTTPQPTTTADLIIVDTESTKEPIPLIIWLAGGGGLLLLLAVGGMIVYTIHSREKENRFVSAVSDPAGGDNAMFHEDSHHTQLADDRGQNSERSGTVFLWEKDTPYKVILQDINNPIKRFEVSLSDPVLVGYNSGCQIRLNYEETVSGNHCRIYSENGKFYVENLSKTNGTQLDGKRVVNTAEIYTGCVLTLGKLKMKVEIR